jgi:hypothetical protein
VDALADQINQAEREASRDRPRDSLSLVCTVLIAQHRAILELVGRVEELQRDVVKLREPW